jgi:hypothetical protein
MLTLWLTEAAYCEDANGWAAEPTMRHVRFAA